MLIIFMKLEFHLKLKTFLRNNIVWQIFCYFCNVIIRQMTTDLKHKRTHLPGEIPTSGGVIMVDVFLFLISLNHENKFERCTSRRNQTKIVRF